MNSNTIDNVQNLYGFSEVKKENSNKEVQKTTQEVNPQTNKSFDAVNVKVSDDNYSLAKSAREFNNAFSSLKIADSLIKDKTTSLENIKNELLSSIKDPSEIISKINTLLKDVDNLKNEEFFNSLTNVENTQEVKKDLTFEINSDEDLQKYSKFIDEAIETLSQYEQGINEIQSSLISSAKEQFSNVQVEGAQTINYEKEIEDFSKQNILNQMGDYKFAQANNINQDIVNKLLA